MNDKRQMLRHALATIAYRGGKPLRDAPASFANFQAGSGVKTPVEILAHVSDLFDWSLWLVEGEHKWRDATPLAWDKEVERFFAALAALDARLASDTPLACTEEKLFQGPIADALTHVGQLVTLRRLSGAPMRSENYFVADIAAGRVGPAQTLPKREF